MDIVLLGVIVGALGGSSSAILAWLYGDDPFEPRKFLSGAIRGAIGGVMLSLTFNLQVQDSKEIVLLFLSALGFDVGAHRGVEILRVKARRKRKG